MGFFRDLLEKKQPVSILGEDSVADFMRDFDPLKAKGAGLDKPYNPPDISAMAFVDPNYKPPVDPLKTLIQPETMPSPNAPSARDARRRSLKSQLARRGRLSTILTEADDSLGATG